MHTQYPHVTTGQRPTRGRHYLLSLLLLWVGIAGLTPTALYAQTGQALSFDGGDDFVEGPKSDALRNMTALTVEIWVRPNAVNQNYVALAYDGESFGAYRMSMVGQKTTFFISDGSSWQGVTQSSTLSLNTWSHIAGVWEGGTLKVYVNGVLDATATTTITALGAGANTDHKLRIGGSGGAQIPRLSGSLDDLRIWNVARTATQIAETKDCELKGNETGLVAYYNFNQGTAGQPNSGLNTLPDGTANGRNGTLTNFALSGTTSNWVAPGRATKCVNCNTFVTRTTANGLGSNRINDVFAVGNTVYAATDGGLSISTDGGQTFVNRTTANGLPNNKINVVAVVGNTVYAGMDDGVARSVDGGANFVRILTSNAYSSGTSIPVKAIDALDKSVYVTAAGNGVGYYLSTNGGDSFSPPALIALKGGGSGVSIVGNRIYVTVGLAQAPRGLYVSTDGGTTFSNVTTFNNGIIKIPNSVYATGQSVYVGTKSGLFFSTNDAQAFTQRTTANGLGGNSVNDVYAVGNRVYAATDNGLSISTNGGANFTNYNTANGLAAAKINAVYAVGTSVYAATDAGLSISGFRPLVRVPGGQPTVASEVTAAPNTSLTLRAADTNTGYSWSPGGATTKTLVVTTSDTYTVTATGDCPGTGSVAITYLTAQPVNAVQVTTSGSGVARVTITIPVTGTGKARLATAESVGTLTDTKSTVPTKPRPRVPPPTVKVTSRPSSPGSRVATTATTARALTLRARPRSSAGAREAGTTYTVTIPTRGRSRIYTVETYDSVTGRLLSVQTFTR